MTQKHITLAMEYDHFIMLKKTKTLRDYFNEWRRESELQQKAIKAAALLTTFANRLRLFITLNRWVDEHRHRHRQDGMSRSCKHTQSVQLHQINK